MENIAENGMGSTTKTDVTAYTPEKVIQMFNLEIAEIRKAFNDTSTEKVYQITRQGSTLYEYQEVLQKKINSLELEKNKLENYPEEQHQTHDYIQTQGCCNCTIS
ncbi:MAG: hypothetical protein Q8Q60_01460 [Candidatus Chromulinivorax sp.]|nr:hypothetical protein [Candidatus Chromulinivorax sp.]